MERLLSLREREGLTYAEAARRGGVSQGTLAWWSWRLRQEGPRKPKARRSGGFVEVEVVEESEAVDAGLEVLIGTHRIRIERGFDEVTLQRLLRSLSC